MKIAEEDKLDFEKQYVDETGQQLITEAIEAIETDDEAMAELENE